MLGQMEEHLYQLALGEVNIHTIFSNSLKQFWICISLKSATWLRNQNLVKKLEFNLPGNHLALMPWLVGIVNVCSLWTMKPDSTKAANLNNRNVIFYTSVLNQSKIVHDNKRLKRWSSQFILYGSARWKLENRDDYLYPT